MQVLETSKALLTPAVQKQWAADVKKLGYQDYTAHGAHLLTCTEVGKRKYEWTFDVFGRLCDLVATEWRLWRPSGVHAHTWYYDPYLAGTRLKQYDVLTDVECSALYNAAKDGYTPTQMAELIRNLNLN
jgi:hypothetical protein